MWFGLQLIAVLFLFSLQPELENLAGKVREQLAKARKEKDELQKMADMYSKSKDPDLHSKAMSEVSAVTAEISVLESDLKRLEKALQPPPQGEKARFVFLCAFRIVQEWGSDSSCCG